MIIIIMISLGADTMFINRVTELELLEKRSASSQAEFFVLYGRRRVGKTEDNKNLCDSLGVFVALWLIRLNLGCVMSGAS